MSYNFGATADKLYKKAQDLAKANAKVKDLENEQREIQNELLAAMNDAGTGIIRGKFATVSISETTRASIADFEAFEKFVLRHKALQLFERRVSSTAYREMRDTLGGKEIPGLSEFTQQRLNVRKV